MKKLLIILIAILTISCSQNIKYLRGNYYDSGPFWTYRFEFLDSLNFIEKKAICDEYNSCYGKYEFDEDKLIFYYSIHPIDTHFVFNKIDSFVNPNEIKILKINMVESYSNKPIENGVVELYDIKTKKLKYIDTCDLYGNIIIKFKPQNSYILKTKFINEKNLESFFSSYYKSEIKLNKDLDYNIQINTVKRTGDLWGETEEYKILHLDSNSLEIESITKPYNSYVYKKNK